jgi:hypothetical protein
MSPKLSEATTLFTFTAARCSMMALALPSRSVDTTNWSSNTAASLPLSRAPGR